MKKHSHGTGKKPKRIFAHVNPLSDSPYFFPISPSEMDWSKHFPDYYPSLADYKKLSNNEKNKIPKVSYVDVGCGFGGLLLRLSELWPNKLGIGMEIRKKAVDIVQSRLDKLRNGAINNNNNDNDNDNQDNINNNKHKYNNVSVIHTNVMKFISHFFEKQSLEIMLFCFPDPHFKKKTHRRRIITVSLLDYYAYLLKDDGLIYNITDVKQLYEWTTYQFSKHSLFERLTDDELINDKVVDLITNKTDEAQRVTRNNGDKYCCVYRRKPNPPL